MGVEVDGIELRETTEKAVGMNRISQDVVDAEPVLKVLEEDFCNLLYCKCMKKNSVIGDDDDDYMNRWIKTLSKPALLLVNYWLMNKCVKLITPKLPLLPLFIIPYHANKRDIYSKVQMYCIYSHIRWPTYKPVTGEILRNLTLTLLEVGLNFFIGLSINWMPCFWQELCFYIVYISERQYQYLLPIKTCWKQGKSKKIIFLKINYIMFLCQSNLNILHESLINKSIEWQ